MRLLFGALLLFCAHDAANSLIVPNELPTLLSLIYSNIPTIKKGTDSRLGWGFALGDRADFQVLVELGPQKYTQPLANQPASNAGNSKRDSPGSFADQLWAKRQQEKKEQISDSEGGKFISNWKKTVGPTTTPPPVTISDVVLGIGEVDAKKVLPSDAELKLQELFKQNNTVKRQIAELQRRAKSVEEAMRKAEEIEANLKKIEEKTTL